jgi:alkylation response protein AidB-like acyl-CoA dehydrogenase
VRRQVIRHKIARMVLAVEGAQSTMEALVFSMSNGAKPSDVRTGGWNPAVAVGRQCLTRRGVQIGGPMALLKVQATSAMEMCAREASQILGGASYLRQGTAGSRAPVDTRG